MICNHVTLVHLVRISDILDALKFKVGLIIMIFVKAHQSFSQFCEIKADIHISNTFCVFYEKLVLILIIC